MTDKKNILFLCTSNSCHSQMAEAKTRLVHKSFDDPPYLTENGENEDERP